MPALQTTKSNWKVMLGIGVCSFVVALFLYQLYSGWAYQVILVPWSRHSTYTVTLADQPNQFVLSAAIYAILGIVLIWGIVRSLRTNLREFRAGEMPPRLDDVTREPLDRR
jgi:uncharacterized membrane protein YoaK (UPF0700 family)